MHHINAADLPAPYASQSVADAAKVVARPRGALPHVPPGFTVSLWAEGLDQPRAIRRAPDGSIFVAEGGAGRVLRFTPDGQRAPDRSRLFVSVGSASNVAQGMRGTPPGGIAAWQAKHGLGAAWGAETERAAVLWFRPEGAGGLHSFAQGLRNCSGLAVEPKDGAVWCATNERDGLGDNLPPD